MLLETEVKNTPAGFGRGVGLLAGEKLVERFGNLFREEGLHAKKAPTASAVGAIWFG